MIVTVLIRTSFSIAHCNRGSMNYLRVLLINELTIDVTDVKQVIDIRYSKQADVICNI
jgi:hypothetical protein